MVVVQLILQLQGVVECPAPLVDAVTKLLQVREEDVTWLDVVDGCLDIEAYRHMQHKDVDLLLGVELQVVV